MKLTDEQYERIARVIDGENIQLTQQERVVMEEIQRYESSIGQYLPEQLEQKVRQRAANRMTAALAGSRYARLRSGAKIAAAFFVGATVAAAIAIAVNLNRPTNQNLPSAAELDRSWNELNALVASPANNANDTQAKKDFDSKVAELEKQLDDLNSSDQLASIFYE